MATKRGKRKINGGNTPQETDEMDLFVNAPPDEDSDVSDDDTTDSEESEYSGLEDEGDSEEEEEDSDDESFEELSGSGGESSEDNDEENEVKNTHKKTNSSTKLKKPSSSAGSDLGYGSSQESSKQQPQEGAPPGDQPDEYTYDSSDEEDIRNTVGNIPMEWYKEYEHIGYDWDGKKIAKPKSGDELDEFLNKMENPDYWRTVKDKTTGQNVKLSDADINFIERLRKGRYTDPNLNPYASWVDFFTHEKMIHPVTNRPEHKRSFIPSLLEKQKVGKIVHAIKMGWIKIKDPKDKKEDEPPRFYHIWESDDKGDITQRHRAHIPAPKMELPGHAESYNPPPEYLFTEEEELAWKEKEPEERRIKFIPQKYSSLRQVPAYKNFYQERFSRCLDLYLCPRQRKMRLNVDPEDLLPKLPKPKDLQPFPTTQSVVYKGHMGMVRSISVSPDGQWLVSGSDDKTIRFWEVSTGRCMKTIQTQAVVKCVAWNPNDSLSLIAATVDDTVLIINPHLGDKVVSSNTDNLLSSYEPAESSDSSKVTVMWEECEGKKKEEGVCLKIVHPKPLSQVTWHNRGDYFAVVSPEAGAQSVMIHQLAKRRTQNPFRKSKGLVQSVLFHPTRPFFFVATQRYVRVYNLLKQEMTKKLLTNCKWISSMSVHSGGDNVIIGSYDCRLGWFDLDLSTKPYKILRHHKKAIRTVSFHKRYPLFASGSDDGNIIICHGMVYNDLLQNPLIVPVKVLRGHEVVHNIGVLACEFHPTQPWVFSSGADSTIRLYS